MKVLKINRRLFSIKNKQIKNDILKEKEEELYYNKDMNSHILEE